jgi:hypothetical protein
MESSEQVRGAFIGSQGMFDLAKFSGFMVLEVWVNCAPSFLLTAIGYPAMERWAGAGGGG